MRADAGTEAAIVAALNEFAARYARSDVQGVMALHAADPDLVVFATGNKYEGPEQVRALVEDDLASFDSITWTFASTSISCAGAVAWVATDATVTGQTGGQAVPLGAYRVTYVFEQRMSQWLIVHGHISAVASQD